MKANHALGNGLYVAKYAASNGIVLWEKGLDVGANWGVQTVAVDSGGNVAVLGIAFLAKYAAADGAMLWEKHYDTTDLSVWPASVAIDDSGSVVITACGPTNNRYYTARYAAADGDLLWEKRFDVSNLNASSPASMVDSWSLDLALGPNGIVAIGGTIIDGPSSSIATVVYRENLPALSIEKVPAGLHLRFTGVPGQSYNVERAANIIGPWTNVAMLTAQADGKIEYIDTVPLFAGAFYRMSMASSP